jgi:hypothetical protein
MICRLRAAASRVYLFESKLPASQIRARDDD